MRVCFISNCILPSYNTPKDGNTFLALEFPRCLAQGGHGLIIGDKHTLDNYDLKYLHLFEHVALTPHSNNKIKDSFTFYRTLKKMIKRTRFDILHLTNTDYVVFPLLCKLFKKTRKLKLIYTISMPYFERITLIDHVLSHLKRLAYSRLFDGLCVTSPLLYELLIKQHLDKEKIFLVPPPINCELFKPQLQPRARAIERSMNMDAVILYFGDLHPLRFPARKILEAIELLKKENLNVILKVVSRYGSDHIKINKMAQEMNLMDNIICYTKSLRNEEKIELYSTADVVLFPFKGFMGIDPPATLLEALSCGKIVLASKIQSMPYIIKNRVNGILIDNLTPEKLAKELKFALTSEKAKKIGEKARQTVLHNFSKGIVTQKLLHMYEQILN